MKKFVCILMALLVLLSLAAPAFADAFVPSIGDKEGPQIVPGKDQNGNPATGVIVSPSGKPVGKIEDDCIVVTPISKVDDSEDIPDAARDLLKELYGKLKDGKTTLPYKDISSDLDPKNMVIREMVDISWLCGDHPDEVKEGDLSVDLTFDLGVNAGTNVYVMVYENGKWVPVKKVVNNGDGTVTVRFNSFGPVVFSVAKDAGTTPPKTGDDANLTLWFSLLAASALGLVAVVVFSRKGARKNA